MCIRDSPYTYGPELLLHFRSDDYPTRTAFRFDLAGRQIYGQIHEIVWHPPLWTPSGMLGVLNRLGMLLASDEPPEYTDPVASIGCVGWPRML
jgi:hypothetical protein